MLIEPEAVSFHGPFADANGNLYRVGETTLADDNNPRVAKSTDGGLTWTYPDDANRPLQSDFEAGNTVQTAGFLHVFFFTGAQYEYHRFNTSDNGTTPDTWTVKRQSVVAPAEATPQYGWGAMLATGDAWAFYQVLATASRLRYKRRTSGVWGSEAAVDDTIVIQQHLAIPGTSDVTHLVYKDDTNNQLKYRTLTSGGTLSGATRVDTSGVPDTRHAPMACPLVRYLDGGSEVIAVAFLVGTGLRVVRITNGTPGAEETVTGATPAQNPGASTNEGVVCSLAADGTTLHLLWSDSSTLDLFHSQSVAGGAWSTPDELRDGVNALWVGAGVFTHSAGNGGKRVLGYTWFEGTDPDVYSVRYHELELALVAALSAVGATTSQGAATLSLAKALQASGVTASGGTAVMQVLLNASGVTGSTGTAALTAGGPPTPPTVSLLSSGGSNTDATSYTTASVSPAPNQPVLIGVDIARTNAEPDVPTVTGNGLTYTLVNQIHYKTGGATTNLKLCVFRAAGASPSAGAVTIDFAGVTHIGCRWDVLQASNADPGGSNGSAAVVQSAVASGLIAAGADLTVSLAAAAMAEDRPVAFYGLNATPGGIGPRANWTELSDNAHSAPAQNLESQWRADTFEQTSTGSNGSGTNNLAMGGIAVELRAAPGAPTGQLQAAGQTASGGIAALSLAVPLQASGLTASQGAVTLQLAKALQASGQTQSSGTATPTFAVALQASGSTVSGGTAALSGGGALQASGQTTSGGVADLVRVAVGLAASGQTASGGSGTLSLAMALAAAGQTVSGGTAALVLAQALAASGQTVSGGSGNLVRIAVGLFATGQTISSGTAALGLGGQLQAVGQTISGGTVSPSYVMALVATGQTQSGGTAALAIAVLIGATGQTQSGGAATLGLARPLAAAGQTASDGAATLSLAKALQASGVTASAGTASLGRLLAASGVTVSGGSAAPWLLLAAAGGTASGGSAALRLAVPVTASGQTTSGGAAMLALAVLLQASGVTQSGGAATLLVFVGIVPEWRGRVTVAPAQASTVVGRGPTTTVRSGPSGVRGG
jgi:hypothetical protein